MSMDRDRSGLKRALRYFLRQAEIYAACIFGGCLLLAVYQQFINGEAISFWSILQLISWTNISVTAVVIFIVDISEGNMWYSVLVSFGCRRKNVYIGSLVMKLLIIGESLLFFWIISEGVMHNGQVWIIPLLAALYLVIAGVEQFLGIAVIKWGKGAYVLLVVVIVVICIAAGAAVVFSDGLNIQFAIFNIISEPLQQWIILLSGAAFCGAACAVAYWLLSHCEVRV